MEQVTINKLDNKGRGIGYYHNKIIFVKNALPGEEVVLKNTHEYKKYFTAEVEKFIKTSDLRNTPKCPYYDVCGGCNLMHVGIDYQETLDKIKNSGFTLGYDAKNNEFVNMVEQGIIDPLKVTRVALESALSASTTILTTEAIIFPYDFEDKDNNNFNFR